MRIKKLCLGLFVFIIVSIMTVYTASSENIKTASINISGYDLYYNSYGSGPVKVIFLHGLFADKSHWNKLTELFKADLYTCLAPDLPCYGQSSLYPVNFAALENQINILHDFVMEMKLSKINLAGSSLGGMLAIAYSIKYPDEVNSISIIGAPTGIFPWSSDLMKKYNMDINPFIPYSPEDFNFEMKCLFKYPPAFPEEYVKKAVGMYLKKKERFISIYNIVAISMYDFSVKFNQKIKCPVLVIFGTDENIFDISNSEKILSEKFPGASINFMPDTGHLPMLENPAKVAEIYTGFLNRNKKK